MAVTSCSSDTQTTPTTPADNSRSTQNSSAQLETQAKYQLNKQKYQQQKFLNKSFSHDSSSSQDCQYNQGQGLGQDMSSNFTQRLNNNNSSNQFLNNISTECPQTQKLKYQNYSNQSDVLPIDLQGVHQIPNNSFFQKKNNKYAPQNSNQLQQSRGYSGYPTQPFQRQESSKDIDKVSDNSSNQCQDEPQRQQQKQYYKQKQYFRQQNDQSFEEDNNNSNSSRERQQYGDRNNNNNFFKNETHYSKMNKMNDSRNFFTPNNQRKNIFQQPLLPPAPAQEYTNQCMPTIDSSYQATKSYPIQLQTQTSSNFPEKNGTPYPPSPAVSCNQDNIAYPQKQQLPPGTLPQSHTPIEPSPADLQRAKDTGKDIENICIDQNLLKQILSSAIDEKLDTLRDEMRSLFENLSLTSEGNNKSSKTTQNEKSFILSDNLSDLHAEAVEIKNPDRERIRSPNKNQQDKMRQQSLDLKEISPGSEKGQEKNKKKRTKRLREK